MKRWYPMVDISVVIPTIGRPEVVRAVRSALGQMPPPAAVIVVDNGPTDGVDRRRAQIEGEFADEMATVRWMSLPPRSGPGMSRNMGAWVADSTYVAFLDDDDEFEAGYLAAMEAAIGASDAPVLYGRKRVCDSLGNQLRIKDISKFPREVWLDRLYSHSNHGFGGQNVVVARDAFFAVGGFPVDLRSGEDRALAIAALHADLDVVNVPDAVVLCHTVSGYRAKADPLRWLSWLQITVENWRRMSWRVRITAVRKTARDALSAAYKAVFWKQRK